MTKKLFCPLLFAFLFLLSAEAYGYKDDVGYTSLKNRLGSSIPDGTGIPVVQVEADLSESPGIYKYMPDTANAEFYGKTFLNKTGLSDISDHATGVGTNFFGNTISMAPGITDIWNYEAVDFVLNNLKITSSQGPVTFSNRRIINNSWIGYSTTNQRNLKALSRIDDVVDKQKIVVVSEMENEETNMSGKVLFSAYNVIAVGLSNGLSSYGPTAIEGLRAKPDIVAPLSTTDAATPVVAAAAAMLLDEGNDRGWADTQNPEVIKSLLMAGAGKLSGWHKGDAGLGDDQTVPLDWKQGAGSLRIDHSYDILTSGEQEASNVTDVDMQGWDFGLLGSGETKRYFFNVDETGLVFQAALVWNRHITAYGDGDTVDGALLRNLDLGLRRATDNTPQGYVQRSLSTTDNVEYIYLDNLDKGRYVLEVTGNLTGVDTEAYGMSWTVIPEPSTIILLGSGLAALAISQRKKYSTKGGKV